MIEARLAEVTRCIINLNARKTVQFWRDWSLHYYFSL